MAVRNLPKVEMGVRFPSLAKTSLPLGQASQRETRWRPYGLRLALHRGNLGFPSMMPNHLSKRSIRLSPLPTQVYFIFEEGVTAERIPEAKAKG
jgi:hypothetical protein